MNGSSPETEPVLKGCPFCGGDDVSVYNNRVGDMHFVVCKSCGLEAPTETGTGEDAAIRYWNTRAGHAQGPGWQPIETAPKDRRILGWDGDEMNTLDWGNGYWNQVSDSGRATGFEPTHWMPLPDPPSLVTSTHAQEAREPDATVEEIQRLILIEFKHQNPESRRAAERVWNLINARAKTLARRATTSVLPLREGQAEECDGGLHSLNRTEASPVTSTVQQPVEKTEADQRRDAVRYRRLQVLGCAPGNSKRLESGTVLRFSGLDEFVDADMAAHPSRGEATVTRPDRRHSEIVEGKQ